MRYLSIDIETTGLNHQTCQLLQVAGIVEDTKTLLPREKCPQFNIFVEHPNVQGEHFAVWMNGWIFEKIITQNFNECEKLLQPHEVISYIYKFCKDHGLMKNKSGLVVPAGKNFTGFDNLFLKNLAPRGFDWFFHHRSLDPATSFTNFQEDEVAPSLDECLSRIGVEKSITHRADDDAWDVIQVLRHKY